MNPLYDFYRSYAAELTLATVGVSGLLVLWLLALQWRLTRLARQYRAAMRGSDGTDLEGLLVRLHTTQQDHEERLRPLEEHDHTLSETVARHAGRVGIVRFNPFQDSGGDQSFAIAWIDEAANGVVLSSLHSRAGVRLYAKPLERGGSAYTLSDEEQRAIQEAQGERERRGEGKRGSNR